MEKWQKEVEEIIKKQFPDNDTSDLVGAATKLLETPVDTPSGEMGKVLAVVMKWASAELPPLTAVYLGFQLGMSWGRFNAG